MKTLRILKNFNWMNVFIVLMIANALIYIHCAYQEICDSIRMSKASYIGYGLSEFLINCKAGYVRRGLAGELIYRLCEAAGCQPMPIILSICVISSLAFAVVLFVMLKNVNIPWWIMFLPFTLGGLPIVRKDYICFLLVLLILYILKKDFKYQWMKILLIYMTSCLLLHVHEAFFFVIVPFVVLYLYFHELSTWTNKLTKIIVSTAPLIVPFLLICHYHGDADTARIIHDSWTKTCPSLTAYQFTTDDSIGAIGWETASTIKFHLKVNARTLVHDPLTLIFIYYILSRFLLVFNDKCQDRDIEKEQSVLNAILQFQFIMLFPLFTVLSIDLGRICGYWIVSSICIYCMLRSEVLAILSDNELILSKKINSLFDHFLKPSKILLCILILFVIVPNAGNPWGVASVQNGFVQYAKVIWHKIK